MPKTRVLVVEDSSTVRERLCEVLEQDAELEVVGQASDGVRAIELCRALRPDVITLDMMLPIMTGLAATEYIMAHFPTPILIVSASTNRGNLFATYDALAAGAVDVLEKPCGNESDADWEERLISTVKLVSRIRVITHMRGKLRASQPPQERTPSDVVIAPSGSRYRVVGVGASTGGPAAILHVLRAMPDRFPLPILIVIHLHKLFAAAFAEWLAVQTARTVFYATDHEPVSGPAGRVFLAPPDRHLLVENGRIRLTSQTERHSCRPSIDTLFESLALAYGAHAVACLLTGMGRDGAAGLLEIRRAGGFTIAQDEKTSIVYGMPREAALLGAAELILPLGEIGALLTALACRKLEAQC